MSDIKNRKDQHLAMAQAAQVCSSNQDPRFYYEPLLEAEVTPFSFAIAGKQMKHPIWISSMTGGGSKSLEINRVLARACAHFGLGLSTGSCRVLLQDESCVKDFDLRNDLGDNTPFFLNIGYSQLCKKNIKELDQWVKRLDADGMVVHINPLQEAMQEQSRHAESGIIEKLNLAFDQFSCPLILKEVGQGFGPQSLKKLLSFPFEALELSGFGGTNFSKLEIDRTDGSHFLPFAFVGNTLEQMIETLNREILVSDDIKSKKFILSGGIKNFLDGFYFFQKFQGQAVFGMASSVLPYATAGDEQLLNFLEQEIRGLALAQQFLVVK